MSLLTTLSFSSSCSFCFLELRRTLGTLARSLFISLGISNTSKDVLSYNSLCLVFVLLSLAREEQLLLLSVLSKLSAFVLLSLAREEEILLFSVLGKLPSSVLLSLA